MRPARTLLVLLSAATFAACGSGGESPALSGEPMPEETTTTSEETTATTEAAAGEEVSAELLAIDVAARTVTVDLIEFLTGEEARAEWKKETGEVDGPPNDYVIRDTEDVEVTYEIAEDATFTVVSTEGAMEEGQEATLDELLAAHELTPFTVRLIVDGDVVTEIHQRYTP
jgi:sulfur carrier protein ThiS